MINIKSIKLPSNRKFGFLFFFLSIILFCYTYFVKDNITAAYGFITAAFFFALVAIFAPKLLYPLNRTWFEVGKLMGKLVSPIVLGAIFFLLITPVAFITRIFGRDQLLLSKNKADSSYWVKRDPVDRSLESFKNQF